MNSVTGIVPKGTTGGLNHFDTTSNMNLGEDGFPIGDEIDDGTGATYLGYRDRWLWRCGLAIADPRYVVRIANIDLDTLRENPVDGGANLQSLLIQAEERFGVGNDPYRGVNASFYAPRNLAMWARLQQANAKTYTNFMWAEYGGKRVTAFGPAATPFRRLDALNVDEAKVV